MRFFYFLLFVLNLNWFATLEAQPKLIVGIVIDQMRWDNLFRYQNRYHPNGGFNKLLKRGFACHNVFIPYIPTVTACGHASVYTGTTPAYHGIVGNEWLDYKTRKSVTSVTDSVFGVSPNRLQGTTIGDQLSLSNNFQSRIYSVALKDRASILPGGHTAAAAFFWDAQKATWKTSPYYADSMPEWVASLETKKAIDAYYKKGWHLLYPLSTYTQSRGDDKIYESGLVNADTSFFPYDLSVFIGKDYKKVVSTPYGLELTADFAKRLIEKKGLGNNPKQVPDMLAVSFSSTDYIGHSYGPNSVETEDTYLRLDSILGDFIDFLERYVGKDNFLLFLTADHGVSPIPQYLKEAKIPAEALAVKNLKKELQGRLVSAFKNKKVNFFQGFHNNQIYLDKASLAKYKISFDEVIRFIVSDLNQNPNIFLAFSTRENLSVNPFIPIEISKAFSYGFHAKNSGDIQVIFNPYHINGWFSETKRGWVARGTTHGAWNSYDAHIPLLWYGAGVVAGESYERYFMTDIAPTVAGFLRIEFPSSNIGNPITEVIPIRAIE